MRQGRPVALVAALALLVALAAGAAAPARASADDVWSVPFLGANRLERSTETQRVHALIVDLCASGVSVRATAAGEAGLTTSAFGQHVGALAAVNGGFFERGMIIKGLALSEGALWQGSFDGSFFGFVAFGAGGARISPPGERHRRPDPWMSEVVGGVPALVVDGTPVVDQPLPFCIAAHPRTAVGLSRDGRALILAVVDGRSFEAAGMTCGELAQLMIELGAYSALNLDGGGSSAMWIQGEGVVNVPSDGFERSVANHLAVLGGTPASHSSCPDVWPTWTDAVSLAMCGAPIAMLDRLERPLPWTSSAWLMGAPAPISDRDPDPAYAINSSLGPSRFEQFRAWAW